MKRIRVARFSGLILIEAKSFLPNNQLQIIIVDVFNGIMRLHALRLGQIETCQDYLRMQQASSTENMEVQVSLPHIFQFWSK